MSLEQLQHRNALPQGFKLHEYEIHSVLGKSGGFGITYLATDTNLCQSVAIKEYLPSDLAIREGRDTVLAKSTGDEEAFQWGLSRFIEEARVLAKFNHTHIVRVIRYFEANGTAYMVMEYQEGQSLAEYLEKQEDKILNEEDLLCIALPLLDGLKKIHDEGFLHRDIKPNNIYIRHDKSPVLLDFGSARYAIGQKSRSITSIVTPGYAPLEQYDNQTTDQGPWTDIYALGGVMYCCIAGEPPPAATRRVIKDPINPAVKIGKGKYNRQLLKMIDWALKVDGEDRPRDIDIWKRTLAPLTPLKQNSSHSIPSHLDHHAVHAQESEIEGRWNVFTLFGIMAIILLASAGGVLVHQNEQLSQERTARLAAEKQVLELKAVQETHERARRKAERVIEQLRRFEINTPNAEQDTQRLKPKYYDIINVKIHDTLNMREFPGHKREKTGEISYDARCIQYLNKLYILNSRVWVMVEYQGKQGWVNSYFLDENTTCTTDS